MENSIRLHHGDGGKHSDALIKGLFHRLFDNEVLLSGTDAAVIPVDPGNLTFTTDSFVVKPLIFPGGDIGKLSVCGTLNDLAVSGARPLYLSVGFIIEEGFQMVVLERIVQSMADACRENGVKIVTGDTKVVEKGFADGLYINTSGIGVIENQYEHKQIQEGDHIIITGGIGAHGTVIALSRYDLKVQSHLESDCGSVYPITSRISSNPGVKLMKDPTRGGLATTLNEIARLAGVSIKVTENRIPICPEVRAVCRLLGMDPLYLACEGQAILVVSPDSLDEILSCMRSVPIGKDACLIGVCEKGEGTRVYLETRAGGKRMLPPLDGPMLPRIC